MFFIEKTAPDAPEKLQTSINTNKPASRVRFISKAIKPVTGRKRFQCVPKCDRLHQVLFLFALSRPRSVFLPLPTITVVSMSTSRFVRCLSKCSARNSPNRADRLI